MSYVWSIYWYINALTIDVCAVQKNCSHIGKLLGEEKKRHWKTFYENFKITIKNKILQQLNELIEWNSWKTLEKDILPYVCV